MRTLAGLTWQSCLHDTAASALRESHLVLSLESPLSTSESGEKECAPTFLTECARQGGRGEASSADLPRVERGTRSLRDVLARATVMVNRRRTNPDRVEKASICIYSAAIEDAYRWSHTAYYDGKGEYETRPLDPSLASTRPHARRFFELCRKHEVNRWPEGQDIYGQPLMFIRRAYGLQDDEPL